MSVEQDVAIPFDDDVILLEERGFRDVPAPNPRTRLA